MGYLALWFKKIYISLRLPWFCGHVVNMFYSCVAVLDCSPILSTFQVILLEHIIMCRLVTGHKATALQEVQCFTNAMVIHTMLLF